MAFDRQANKIPTSIGEIRIKLLDENGDALNMSTFFVLQVLDQDGIVLKEIVGDLAPHLTQGEITALINFMQTLRQRATEQVLPTP